MLYICCKACTNKGSLPPLRTSQQLGYASGFTLKVHPAHWELLLQAAQQSCGVEKRVESRSGAPASAALSLVLAWMGLPLQVPASNGQGLSSSFFLHASHLHKWGSRCVHAQGLGTVFSQGGFTKVAGPGTIPVKG